MSIKTALEIDRLKPIKNGIYVCIDEKKQEYKIIPLEKALLKLNNQVLSLEDVLSSIILNQEKIKKDLLNVIDGHNELVVQFKRKVVIDSIERLGN